MSDLELLAEKILQEKQARRNYFQTIKKGTMAAKQEALERLKKVDEEVEMFAYGILHQNKAAAFGGRQFSNQ